jgi:phosphatidylinositol alpha-mannosyltransferase
VRIGLVSAYALDVPGGVQEQVTGLARALRGRGHPTALLAPGPGPSGAGRVVGVRGNGSVARVAVGALLGRRVLGWVREHDLDLVHLHEPLAPGLPGAVLRSSPVPVVATVHAAAAGPLLRMSAPVLRRRLRAAHLVTAVSRHAARTLTAIGHPADLVVPNGLDALPSQPLDDPPAPAVVCVGRLGEPRKGIDVLLAAWPEIRHHGGRLVLVGPGIPRGGRHGLPAGVTCTGTVDRVTRDALVRSASVVVAPHRGGESFGLVVAEAMALGRPVVASALPAFVDLLGPVDGRPPAGWLVPPGRPVDLAAAVNAVLKDPVEAAARAREGRRRVAGFDWPIVADQWLRAYAAAHAGPRRRPTMPT